ncbi:MAG: ABC transporter ATP-binding protein [Rhodobacteraceae bacterium]|nr:ABC transporter ATP-binding protein [Paracoccaceae bacterium]MCY4137443.1 ABC transporter ATP-binding protein [Paracoccaceae bacterium]
MSAPILSVSDLSVRFGPNAPVVDKVSFDIFPGETLAIVGESGSGKSVTALSTVGLLPENAFRSGTVTFRETDLIAADERTLRRIRGNAISFIFQEPMTSLNPLHTISRQIGESLAVHQGLTGKGARDRIVALLNRVGIQDPESRLNNYPHQLSGGQRQRVMIAMSLANQPALLIADEPTTALDVTIQAQILDLLAEVQKSEHMSLLFITHDLTIVEKFSDRVCVMQAGRIVEQGETRKIFERPEHPYTQQLLSAEPTGSPPPVAPDAKTIVTTESLRVWFPVTRGLLKRTVGHIKAVNGATIRIRAGETIGIVGESGSGKTTLALAIMRLITSDGPVTFMGRNIQGLRNKTLRPLRSAMQIVFQDPYGSLSPRMTIRQIVSEGLLVHGSWSDDVIDQKVSEILLEVGLDPTMADRYPHEFSGGQRQRIAVARAMVLRPSLVVLDEPTSALDRTVQVQIIELLRDFQREYGIAYLFISHDLKVVRSLSHRVLVMYRGDVVESGSVDEIFDRPKTDYTKSLMAAAIDLRVEVGASE